MAQMFVYLPLLVYKVNCKSDYWIQQSLQYSIKIMADHVKPKSMCCIYNNDFKSLVIKHAEGNNNQDLAWKFCIVQQNVQTENKRDY
jgi:hypothetical protein